MGTGVETSSGGGLISLIQLAIFILTIVSMWKVFAKADEPGWAIFIPIFNLYVMLKIAGKPWWWLLLFCIPLVNLIIAILATVSFAQNFGKGVGFALGLIFLPFIFYPILAFSDADYVG